MEATKERVDLVVPRDPWTAPASASLASGLLGLVGWLAFLAGGGWCVLLAMGTAATSSESGSGLAVLVLVSAAAPGLALSLVGLLTLGLSAILEVLVSIRERMDG